MWCSAIICNVRSTAHWPEQAGVGGTPPPTCLKMPGRIPTRGFRACLQSEYDAMQRDLQKRSLFAQWNNCDTMRLRPDWNVPMTGVKWKRRHASRHICETSNFYSQLSSSPFPAGVSRFRGSCFAERAAILEVGMQTRSPDSAVVLGKVGTAVTRTLFFDRYRQHSILSPIP